MRPIPGCRKQLTSAREFALIAIAEFEASASLLVAFAN